MTEETKVKCSQGGIATKICYTKQCKIPPLMCSNESCSCSKDHKFCMRTSTILSMILHMEKKGETLIPVLELLLQWYDSHIKKFMVMKEQVKSFLHNHKLTLAGFEGQLYRYIKDGESQNVTTNLVGKALNSLQNVPIFLIQNKMQMLKKHLLNVTSEVDVISTKIQELGNVKKYTGAGELDIIRKQNGFMLHPNLQFKNSTLTYKVKGSSWIIGLLDQSIESFGTKKQTYKFKVKKLTNNNIYFGLCYSKTALASNFAGLSGSYSLYSNNGNIIMPTGQQQPTRVETKIVNIVVNQQVHIRYTPANTQLEIKNITKNQFDTITIKLLESNPLYPCVAMYNINDEVEFLGMVIDP